MSLRNLTKMIADRTAKDYQNKKLQFRLVGMFIQLVYLTAMAFAGGRWLADILTPVSMGSRWLLLFEFAFVFWLGSLACSLPVSYLSSYKLEHRYYLSNQTLSAWAWKQTKMQALGGVLGLILIAGLYLILWNLPDIWWILAAIGYLFLTVVLAQLLPVLFVPIFYKVSPLDEESGLLDRLRGLAAGTGLELKDVSRINMSKETKKVNAFLSGLGKTKSVMFGDTLLNHLEPEEIDVVFTHEVGHYVHRHVLKSIAFAAVAVTLGLYLCDVILQQLAPLAGHASFTAVSAMPLFFFMLTVFGLILRPVESAFSRHNERQSDWYALQKTRDPDSFRSAFSKLADINKADMSPHPLVVFWFYTHPPIPARIAMADRWRSENSSGSS